MVSLSFDVAWHDRGAQAGLRGLATQTTATQKTFLGLKAATEQAASGLKQAQEAAAASVRRVKIEEQKLQELRDSGKVKASQLMAAEDRLARARKAGDPRQIEIAEQKLQEIRDSGKAKASQLLAAEDRLATARRRSTDAIDAAAKASRTLEHAEKAEADALRGGNTATEKAGRAVRQLSTDTGHASTAVSKFGSAFKSIGNAGMAGLGRDAAKFGSAFKSIGKAGLVGAAVGAAGAIAGLAVGLKKSIDSASKFDVSMRLVGVTTGQTGKGLKDLTRVAMEMGATTSFSAQGASDAMLALAKGGLTAAQIKAGALQSTLTLATAGGLELGDAATYMVQGLSAFGLKASQAGKVAAALAGGANASTASVQSMGLALSQVGAQARTAGLSLTDTTAALAAFANAGVQGSDAGTSLKTFLQRLIPTTDAATGAMKKLGLVTKDGKNAFFDAAGNMKSMSEVAGILQEALKGQTREQKLAALTTIFGSDASRAAAILATEGAKGIDKYTKATSDQTAAEKLAKNATAGYAGALERFKGSVETAQIALGTKLLPILTTVLNYLSDSGVPVFQGMTNIISKTFLPSLNKGVKGLTEFLGVNQAPVLHTFKSIGDAVFTFFEGFAHFVAGAIRQFANFNYSVTSGFLDTVSTLLHALDTVPFIDMGDSIEQFDKLKSAAIVAAGKSSDSLTKLANSIDNKTVPSIEALKKKFDEAADKEIIKAAQRDAVKRFGLAVDGVGTSLQGAQIHLGKWSDRTHLSAKEQAALRNRLHDASGALGDQLKAMKDAHVGQDKLSGAWEKGKDRLYKEFRQMGLSKTEAHKLAAQYAGIKPKVETKFSAPHLDEVTGKTKTLDRTIRGIDGKTVKVKVQFDAGGKISIKDSSGHRGPQFTAGSTGTVLPGFTPGRDVHMFHSPTGGTLALSGGEAVMRPEWTQAVGGVVGVNRMNAAARSGGAPAVRSMLGMADGGITRFIRINAGTSGSVPLGSAMNAAELGAAWAGARDARWAAARIVKYAKDQTAAAAGGGGGPIGGGGFAAGLRFARRQGGPYRFGGVGPRAYDCSGFMSAIDNVVHGRSPYHRLFSTTNFHGQANGPGGFHHNKRSPFMIGITNRGAGGGHMAGTINGVNVESSGGRGAHTGRSARGWHNGLFSMHYGLARGGIVGDLPYDTINPHGQNYDKAAALLAHMAYGTPMVHDRGGRLAPGDTLVRNSTRQPERVLTPMQNRAFEQMARVGNGGGQTINVTINASFPNYVGNRSELKRTLQDMGRNGDMRAILASAGR